jgi:hypothetical protein
MTARRRWAARVAVVGFAATAFLLVAGVAAWANDTCNADALGDCQNTGAVIGLIGALVAAFAGATAACNVLGGDAARGGTGADAAGRVIGQAAEGEIQRLFELLQRVRPPEGVPSTALSRMAAVNQYWDEMAAAGGYAARVARAARALMNDSEQALTVASSIGGDIRTMGAVKFGSAALQKAGQAALVYSAFQRGAQIACGIGAPPTEWYEVMGAYALGATETGFRFLLTKNPIVFAVDLGLMLAFGEERSISGAINWGFDQIHRGAAAVGQVVGDHMGEAPVEAGEAASPERVRDAIAKLQARDDIPQEEKDAIIARLQGLLP